MRPLAPVSTARREFLKFLAACPYVAALGGVAAFLERTVLAQNNPADSDLIASPAAALNVFDFEEIARRNIMPGHWAFLVSGVDDDGTIRANREGYQHVQLRPRRLRDATQVDMRVNLLGAVYSSPIFLCPVSGHRAFFGDGELSVARAAKARNTLLCLSTMTSTAIEDVTQAYGRPVWQQFYAPNSWDACEKIMRRVEATGCTVLALTVDNTTGRNSETFLRRPAKGPDPVLRLSHGRRAHAPGAPHVRWH